MEEKMQIPINKELHKRLKVYCAKNDLMIKKVVESLIEEELKKGAEAPINKIH